MSKFNVMNSSEKNDRAVPKCSACSAASMSSIWYNLFKSLHDICTYAVHLQKFCSGAYNVIVASSICEEGLDIMEVNLVVAFDANISPLRMIQRMGRTGRKHDGQVDILWFPNFGFQSCCLALLLRIK